MSDIEHQEKLEAEQDEFNMSLFSKRASRPANVIIRCFYAPNLTPGPKENILIMDSAADQSVIGQGFKIMFYTGQHIKMDGALVGMEGGQYTGDESRLISNANQTTLIRMPQCACHDASNKPSQHD